MNRIFRLLAVLVAGALAPAAFAYTFTLQPGFNLVANHVNIAAGNNVSQVFAAPPDGSYVEDWQSASQQFVWAGFYYSGSGWSPDPLLNPGGGMVFNLPAGSPMGFTVVGTAPTPSVVTLTPGQFALLGNATATASSVPGTYASIVGAVPSAAGTTWLLRWDAVAQSYLPHRFVGGSWVPSVPLVPVGESVLIGVFPVGLPAPNVASAVRGCDTGGDFIRVTFDQDVDPLTASSVGNFSVTGGPIVIVAAQPEFAGPWSGAMPLPTTRSVLLRVSGVALATPTLLTVKAPGVTGLGGTPVNGASFAQLQTLLVATALSVDCTSGMLCMRFNQAVDPSSVMFLGNYAVTWTYLSSGASGTLPVNYASLYGSGSQGGSNRFDQICINVGTVPSGNILFTVTIDSTTTSPLVSRCGSPMAVTPYFVISAKCNPVVTGRVFRHQSLPECVQDLSTSLYGSLPNEYGLPWQPLLLTDGLDNYFASTDANGDFKVSAPPGTYTLQYQLPPGWVQQCPLGGASISLTLAPAGTYSGNLFSVNPVTPVKDLSVYLYSRSQFPPYRSPCCGFDTTLVADYRNTGTEVILGATVQLVLPPASLATFVSSTEVPLLPLPYSASPSPVGGVITWTLPPLVPGQFGQLEAKVTLTCPVGSLNTMNATATITTPPGDPTPADNTSAYSRQTTCSVDPNDKTVRPRGCGPEGFVPVGTEFEYFIQFQNTGSGPAYQVILHDMLDPSLDPATVQLLGGSHPFVFAPDPFTGELVWRMEGIDLPGSIYDEPHSHGWVRFKVQHYPGLPAGTVITNGAAIDFDLNPPVLTATTTNTLSANPLPLAAFTFTPASPFVGQTVHFTYTGGTPGVTYAWDFGPDATPSTSTVASPTVVFSSMGKKPVSLVVYLGDCASEPAVMAVPVRPTPTKPVITVQPVSITTTSGFPAQLTAQISSSADAVYRWSIFCPPTRPDYPFCGCIPMQEWRPWCPACPPPFVDFPSVTAQCAGDYVLVASNAFGMVTSEVATVTVLAPPVITVQPVTQIAPRCPSPSGGSGVSFTVEATGTPAPDFYWGVWCPPTDPNFPNCGCIPWPPVRGSGTLSISTVTPQCAGKYFVVVSNAMGSVTSLLAELVLAPEVVFSNDRFPTPNSQLEVGSGGLSFASVGVLISNLTLRPLGSGQALPAPGAISVLPIDFEVLFQLSTDGGVSFHFGSCSGHASVRAEPITATDTRFFDTEMLSLNLTGGSLPSGMMLRESPTRASAGKTSISPSAGGTHRISSFFDIFTELSMDGGQTWIPADGGSRRSLLQPTTREFTTADASYPPTGTEISQAADGKDDDCDGVTDPVSVVFSGGLSISGLTLSNFVGAVPFTSLSSPQIFNLSGVASLDLHMAVGSLHCDAPAVLTIRAGNRASTTFDTEMLALNLAGGGLPAGVMLRESPTRASLGYASLRANGDGTFRVSSFFDIFTELSMDGGQTWSPAVSGPMAVGLGTLSPAAAGPCVTNTIVLNTGYDHVNNLVYPYGTADAFWRVVSDPDAGTTEPRPATTILKHPAWWNPTPGSQWLSSYGTYSDSLNGDYIFETTFCLEQGWKQASLSVQVRADDAAGIYLNGNYVGAGDPYNSPSPATLTAINQAWFVTGPNILRVVVTNIGAVAMGFNLTGTVSASGLTVGKPECCNRGSGLSGRKFNDLNGNGLHDYGEPWLSGWTIQLSNGSNTVTDVNGYYYFMGLAPGTYTITEVNQAGWTQTAPAGGSYTATLGTAQQFNNLDFGNHFSGLPQGPQIICADKPIELQACPEGESLIPNLTNSVVVTNVSTGGYTITQNPPAGSPAHPGPNVVVITVCDAMGLCASCTNVVYVTVVGPPQGCATDIINFNTGYDHVAGAIYPIGAADAYWTVVSDPDPGTTEPRPATTILKHPAWWTPMTNSQWISSYATAQDDLNGPYAFQTTFCLRPGWSNAVLDVDLRADDTAAVYVNGNYVGTITPPLGYWCFNQPVPQHFTVVNQAWFNSGVNFLKIVVTNTANVAMGLNAAVTLRAAGLTVQKPQCCNCRSGLSGQKFADLNGNGVRDPGEPALPGWTIQLSNGATAVTDVNGYYYFMGLSPGLYTINEVNQPGWTQTAPAGGSYNVTLGVAQQINQLNFGNIRRDTNAPVIECFNQTLHVKACTDGGAIIPNLAVAVYVWDDTTPSALITVTQTPPAGSPAQIGDNLVVVTACDQFGNCASCTNHVFVVQHSPTGGTCAAQGINLNTGYDHINNTTNAIGIADAFWTVVFDPDAFTTEPRPATAILRHPAWQTPIPGSQWIGSYATYSDNLNGDYGFETTFCLAQGWSNAVLTLQSVADDAAGIYLNGNYIGDAGPYSGPPSTITAINQAWFVTGQNVLRVVVTNLGAVAMGFDLTGTLTAANLTVQKPECCRCVSGLSGHKFNDLNGNGVQDFGEPNLAGWTIVLTSGTNTMTAVTDAHGDYYFMNLPPGVYTVGEVMQPGWVQTAPSTGTYTVALSAAQQINQLNFGNTVRDTDPPIIDCRGETIFLDCKLGTVSVIPDMTTNVLAWDNTTPYPLLVFTQMPPAGTPAGPGTNVVVIKVCDAAGNCAYCTNYVVLVDHTPPTPCDQPTVTVLSAGTVTDDFTGPEPATPSPALVQRLPAGTPLKGFDSCQTDSVFAHTFSQLPPCIVGAQLRIRLKACGSQAADNDTIGLSFTLPDGTLLTNRWGRYIGAGNAFAGLLGSQWSPGSVATFTWNLNALPNADGSFTDLIPQLAQLGFLDITVQDDSAVDFIELRIVSCCCPQKDIVVPADPATCTAMVEYPLPVFHDNCDGLVKEVVCRPPSGSLFPIGTTEVCCVAHDSSGNVGRCCFTVTVTAPPPYVVCRQISDTVLLDCYGKGVPAPDLTHDIQVVTPCLGTEPNVTVTQTPPAGTVLGFGPHQIVVSACDPAGHCYLCTNNITVIRDTVPPQVICPPGPVIVTNCEGKGLVPDFIKASKYSDNCPNTLYSINQIPGPGTIVGPGSYTVISTICDGAGNCTSCTNTFIVVQGQGESCGCVKPPRGLVLWLPMDETNNVVANNRAGGPNGTYVGNPSISPQYVLRGRCFNGNNYVKVPSYGAIVIGTGDLSIDAWIKRGPNDNSPPSIIVDKRVQNGTQITGYSLALSYGRLIFQLATGASFVNYADTAIVPADGNWHFVAVTVRRTNTTGIQFYIGGLPTTTANPTGMTGSVANSAPFLVALSSVAGAQPWPGCIDEVELFNRVLLPAEVLALARADHAGKCKYSASVPQTVTFCKSASTVTILAKICNQGGQGETFTWTINGLSAGGAYNVAGPATYTPPGGSVFVPAGACVTIPIVITRPPWMSTAWFVNMIGGYQFTAQALHSGTIVSATGAVHRPPWGICFNVVSDVKVMVPVGVTAAGGGTGRASKAGSGLGSGTDVTMDLDNTDGTNAICHLRFRVQGPDAQDDTSIISLNGLPPGTPYQDLLFSVPPGQVGHASVNIAFLADDPNNDYTLLIEGDVDCDGSYEILGSTQIRQVFQSLMNIGTSEGASGGGLLLDWSSEGVLEWAPSVFGPWTELPEASPPYESPNDGAIKVYRVRQ